MRPDLVVVPPPCLDEDLGLGSAAEPLDAQALVAELVVKALVGAILPRLAWIDGRGVDVDSCSHLMMAEETNSGPLSERR
jgi:hypothetical protein